MTLRRIQWGFDLVAAAAALLLATALTNSLGLGAALAIASGGAAWAALAARRTYPDRNRSAWARYLFDYPGLAAWLVGLLLLFPGLPILLPLWALHLAPWGPLVGMGALPAAMVVGWGLGPGRLWLRSELHEVTIPTLPPGLDGLRLLHLSDLHFGSWDGERRFERWLEAGRSGAPDLVVITGDFVTTGVAFYEAIAHRLRAAFPSVPIYAVLGNHDEWDRDQLLAHLRAADIHVLCNSTVSFTRGSDVLLLGGVDDHYVRRASVSETLSGGPLPQIVLVHYPHFFPLLARRGVPIVLAGHTHGGQLAVPWVPQWHLGRAWGERAAGWAQLPQSRLYVHPGLGTTGLPFRWGVRPALVWHVLRATGKGREG